MKKRSLKSLSLNKRAISSITGLDATNGGAAGSGAFPETKYSCDTMFFCDTWALCDPYEPVR